MPHQQKQTQAKLLIRSDWCNQYMFNKAWFRIFLWLSLLLIIAREVGFPKGRSDAIQPSAVALKHTRKFFKSFQITLQGVNPQIKLVRKKWKGGLLGGPWSIHTPNMVIIKSIKVFQQAYLVSDSLQRSGANTLAHGYACDDPIFSANALFGIELNKIQQHSYKSNGIWKIRSNLKQYWLSNNYTD